MSDYTMNVLNERLNNMIVYVADIKSKLDEFIRINNENMNNLKEKLDSKTDIIDNRVSKLEAKFSTLFWAIGITTATVGIMVGALLQKLLS